jgi:hypothetical protein
MRYIKIIILCCAVFIISCRKTGVSIFYSKMSSEFFQNKTASINNGDVIQFSLQNTGTYYLSMMDTLSINVVSRVKINGVSGLNTCTIYTNTLPSKYLYIILEDSVHNQIAKTQITIN